MARLSLVVRERCGPVRTVDQQCSAAVPAGNQRIRGETTPKYFAGAAVDVLVAAKLAGVHGFDAKLLTNIFLKKSSRFCGVLR
jgi:hypothetical protein